MKVAVIGPVVKDIVTIDGVSEKYIGGIPYYESRVLRALGAEVAAFVTYAKDDKQLVEKNFKGVEIHPIYTETTLVHELIYSSKNPDVRKIIIHEYSPNIFSTGKKLINTLEGFDYIILGPLYFENVPYEFFEQMKGSNLVLGNYGLFTYNIKGIQVRKNPENLANIAQFLKLLFLDEDEIKFAAQKETIEDSANHFLKLGVGCVVVTKGSKGSEIFTKDNKYSIPAFIPQKIVDPTGAGDTYLSAFIYSEKLFNDIQKRGEFAAMAATIVIEKKGAFNGSTEEIMDRLKKQK